jgi:hypothetical protein
MKFFACTLLGGLLVLGQSPEEQTGNNMDDSLVVPDGGNVDIVSIDSSSDEPDSVNSSSEEKVDDFGDNTTPPPPKTLIYVCGGTAKNLAYCQFPFSTLAGNYYTSTCADKVEDNPDYSVDRPWCFTSSNEWGFCDCDAFFDFTYFTEHNAENKTLRDIKIQVKLDYPGTVWCSLWKTPDSLPSLEDIEASRATGGSTSVSEDMIARKIDGQVGFSATPEFMKSHLYLSCQAHVPGLLNQPKPVVTQLGTKKDLVDDPDDDAAAAPPKARLVTQTSGALMYSTLIIMVLASFFFYQYAMDRRAKVMSFMRISQEDSHIGQ